MLTMSERIRLVTEISRKLDGETFHHVNMILEQLDLGTEYNTNLTNYDYLVARLPRAADEKLTELAIHLDIRVNQPSPVSGIWQPGQFRLFVSHLAIYKAEAGELRDWLTEMGVSAFVAHTDIEPTAEWQEVILGALKTCDAMVALLHEGFHDSKWTDQEIGFALASGILIIPVRIGVDPYGFIQRYQGLNGIGKATNQLAREIIGIMAKHALTADKLAEILVKTFEESGSFDDAALNAKALLDIKYWRPSLIERCREARKSNSQIRGSRTMKHHWYELESRWEAISPT